MRRIALTLSLLILLVPSVSAIKPDSSKLRKTPSLSFDLYWGYLQYHHPEMAILKQSPARAVKFSYGFGTSGNKPWQSTYRYPQVGLSYTLMDLGYRDVLGYSHALSPFISIPVIKQAKGFSSVVNIGAGLGFMPKVYHPSENSLNTAISTHLNVYIDIGLRVTYQLNSNLMLNGGAHIVHFSNGSIKKPNYGLNYTLLSIGVQYGSLNAKRGNNGQYRFDTEKNRLQVIIAGSQKEAMGVNGPRFGVATGSIEYSFPVWLPLFRVGASLDFMYDQSHGTILENSNISYKTNVELTKMGAAVSAEAILDRLSLILHFGGYVHNLSRDIKNQWVYQRVGLRYRFSDRLWAHLGLKTHWNIADYIELGLAVKVFP